LHTIATGFIELPWRDIPQAVVMATAAQGRTMAAARGGVYGSDGDNCVIDLFTINTHTPQSPLVQQKLG